MQAHKNKAYPLRIPEDIKKQLEEIADKNDRSLNQQILYILKQYLIQYNELAK
ncbi:type II toxin-antitoxin system antitoxin [Lacrimispora brassicae]